MKRVFSEGLTQTAAACSQRCRRLTPEVLGHVTAWLGIEEEVLGDGAGRGHLARDPEGRVTGGVCVYTGQGLGRTHT